MRRRCSPTSVVRELRRLDAFETLRMVAMIVDHVVLDLGHVDEPQFAIRALMNDVGALHRRLFAPVERLGKKFPAILDESVISAAGVVSLRSEGGFRVGLPDRLPSRRQ